MMAFFLNWSLNDYIYTPNDLNIYLVAKYNYIMIECLLSFNVCPSFLFVIFPLQQLLLFVFWCMQHVIVLVLHTYNLILYVKVLNYLFTREVCQEKRGKDKYSPCVTNQIIPSDKKKLCVHLCIGKCSYPIYSKGF